MGERRDAFAAARYYFNNRSDRHRNQPPCSCTKTNYLGMNFVLTLTQVKSQQTVASSKSRVPGLLRETSKSTLVLTLPPRVVTTMVDSSPTNRKWWTSLTPLN